MHTIESLKALLSRHDHPGLALDIDDTLAVTGRSWYDGLKKVAGDPGMSFEDATEKYAGRFQHIPAWQGNAAIEDWIQKTIHRGEYYLELQVIERALERVRDVHMHVPVHAYITMRPTSVLTHTMEWLKKHGFPDLPILAQPADMPHAQRHVWKAQAITELYPHIRGVVDDDPNILNHLPAEYPGTIYLFGRDTFSQTDKRVVPCKNWDIVYEHVKVFGKK